MSSQEQPEDQQPDAANGEAEAGDADQPDQDRVPETPDDAGDDEGAGGPPTEDERLEQLTERIDKARAQAGESGVLDHTGAGEYVESGATEEEDDQTITPPG